LFAPLAVDVIAAAATLAKDKTPEPFDCKNWLASPSLFGRVNV